MLSVVMSQNQLRTRMHMLAHACAPLTRVHAPPLPLLGQGKSPAMWAGHRYQLGGCCLLGERG